MANTHLTVTIQVDVDRDGLERYYEQNPDYLALDTERYEEHNPQGFPLAAITLLREAQAAWENEWLIESTVLIHAEKE